VARGLAAADLAGGRAMSVFQQPDRTRKKVQRIREKQERGEPLTDDEEATLDAYPTQRNRSASKREVHVIEEAAAEGDHPHPEAYAAQIRAEGLRADTVLRILADMTLKINDQYMIMNEYMLKRTLAIEDRHVQLMDIIYRERMARMDAEADARAAAEVAGDDHELESMLRMVMEMRRAKELDAARRPHKRKKVKKEKPLGEV